MPAERREQITRWDRVNWQQEELTVLAEGGSFHWVARAV